MEKFTDFKTAIQLQFIAMVSSELFMTEVSKDDLWKTYLDSFPEGTNPIYKERREHDCQCCKQFIRICGNMVGIVNNKLVSIWDIEGEGHYKVVADAMSTLVKSQAIRDLFLHYEKTAGTDKSNQLLESGDVITWNHFQLELPQSAVARKDDIATKLSKRRSNRDVLKRGLMEISLESAETVLELIDQKSVYRGAEHKATVETFAELKKEFGLVPVEDQDNFCWTKSYSPGIKNTVIGTLLMDISEGKDLDVAVVQFGTKMDPTNCKRPSSIVTKSMISNAQKTVVELGIEPALFRRFATIEDITANNILFADRGARQAMSVFDEMAKEVSTNIKNLEKVDEVDIQTFVDTILPKADSIEMMFENKHTNNLMSLIAPQELNAPKILKWDNNFSWAYTGEVADSMKERVKKAGGKVDGVLRCSIQWNDGDNNQNDFDVHCKEPNGNLIYYGRKRSTRSCGQLDVDITRPRNKIAVENITWADIQQLQEGKHEFLVHNYSHNGGTTGFTAEIEFDGIVHSYSYNQNVKNKGKIKVANVTYSKRDGFKIEDILPSSASSREAWGISTNQFHRVSLVMNSPNHWDDKTTGNKHYFFILDGCHNDQKARGFFNEFLKEDLTEHRKVFEVLGSKLRAEKSDNQLSGLGFSSTQKNQIVCKVKGSFARTVKINF